MIVTEIEDCGSGKRKVYLDGQPVFVLYRGELSGCHIEKDQELPEAVYREIMDEILWKRIRMRCLYLLKSMDRTEYQLRTKLKQNFYPEELIDRVILWLENLHYLDDVRYAESYIRTHGESLSTLQLKQKLMRKGFSSSGVRKVLQSGSEMQDEYS